MRALFHLKKNRRLTLVATFVATPGLGSIKGILIAWSCLSCLHSEKRLSPDCRVRVFAKRGVFRNLRRFPGQGSTRGCFSCDRFLPLFCNLEFVRDLLEKRIVERLRHGGNLRFSSVNDMDAPAIDALEEIMAGMENGRSASSSRE